MILPLEKIPWSSTGNFDWDERVEEAYFDGSANTTELINQGSGYLGTLSQGYMCHVPAERLIRLPTGIASGATFLHLSGLPLSWPETHPACDSVPRISRHIRSPPPLLDQYINAYFNLYHLSYPILHEATFRAQHMEIIPRPPDGVWHALLYVVAALGACTIATEESPVHHSLFETAKSRLSFDLLEAGSMGLVQVLALIAQYAQKNNKPNSGYTYLGLARRAALAIGLHRECSEWEISPWQIEMRRRVWWCSFIFDFGASITFSRPVDLLQGVDIPLPLNIHDEVGHWIWRIVP
jgi:transcriptional regulatory protein GAL4